MIAGVIPPPGHLLGGLTWEEERLDTGVGSVAADLVPGLPKAAEPARIAPTGKDSGLNLSVFASPSPTPGHHHPAFLLEVLLHPGKEDVHQALSAVLVGDGLAATLDALTQFVGLITADMQIFRPGCCLDSFFPEVQK